RARPLTTSPGRRTPDRTFQVIAAGSDTDFDDPNAPDYQIVTGSVAYDRLGAVTTLAARVGYTSIDRELGRDSVEGVVGGVDITRDRKSTRLHSSRVKIS